MRLFVMTIAYKLSKSGERTHTTVSKAVLAKTALEATAMALADEQEEMVLAHHVEDQGADRVVFMSYGRETAPDMRKFEREGSGGWTFVSKDRVQPQREPFRISAPKPALRPSLTPDQMHTGIEVGLSDAFLAANEAQYGSQLRDRRGRIESFVFKDAQGQRVKSYDPAGSTTAYVAWEREDGSFGMLPRAIEAVDLSQMQSETV